MGDFTFIRAVSLTLKALLEDHITNSSDAQLNGVPIDLRTPKELREAGNLQAISLWLYRVARNADLYSRPNERPQIDQVARRALPLDLYYLVTPLRREPEAEQMLLGRVMQTFHDHALLTAADFRDSLVGQNGELRLTLEMLTLEETTRVWTALAEPYQLSVTYNVQAVTIDSDHAPVQGSPVVIRQTAIKQIVSVT